MGRLTLNSSKKNNETAVSNIFLDVYMKNANGEFVKVYLYLLRCMGDSSRSITTSDIADNLNMTEKDVVRAFKYWNKEAVISVEFDSEGNDPVSITFLPLEENNTAATAEETVAPEVKTSERPASVSYTAAQIKRMREQEDNKQLFYIIEQYVAKPLSPADASKIIFMKDSLNMSSELIEYLVEYCVSNKQTSFRYMEKIALSWFDNGITTVEDAKNEAQIFVKRNAPVLKSFGIKGRNLTPAETEFIDRWYDEYGFDSEIIVEACNRTVISMGKPNFTYADGILRKWRSAGVHTPEDLRALDSGFRKQFTVPVGTAPAKTNTTNKFNNFSQRSYDFDEVEKRLISNKKQTEG